MTYEQELALAKADFEFDLENFQNALDLYEIEFKAGNVRALTRMGSVKYAAKVEPIEYINDFIKAAQLGDLRALARCKFLPEGKKYKNELKEVTKSCDAAIAAKDPDVLYAAFELHIYEDPKEGLRFLFQSHKAGHLKARFEIARAIMIARADEKFKKILVKISRSEGFDSIAKLDFDISILAYCPPHELLSRDNCETWAEFKKWIGVSSAETITPEAWLFLYWATYAISPRHTEIFFAYLQQHLDTVPAISENSILNHPKVLAELALELYSLGGESALSILNKPLAKMGLEDEFRKRISIIEPLAQEEFLLDDDEAWLLPEQATPVHKSPEELAKEWAIQEESRKRSQEISAETQRLDEQIEYEIELIRGGEGSWKKVIKLFEKYRNLDEESLAESWFYEDQICGLVKDSADIFDPPGPNAIQDPAFFEAMLKFIEVGGNLEVSLASSAFCPKHIVLELLGPDYEYGDYYSLSVQQVVSELQIDPEYFAKIVELGSDDRAMHNLAARADVPLHLLSRLVDEEVPTVVVYPTNSSGKDSTRIDSHLKALAQNETLGAPELERIHTRVSKFLEGAKDDSLNNKDQALEIEKLVNRRLEKM